MKISSRVLLFTVLILGAILRFTNINWDSFLAFHPDERNIAWAVTRIHFFDQLNPQFFAYGGLPIYLYRALGEAVVFITKDPSWLTEWGKIAVIGRFVSALLSSISVLLIYQVATMYFSKRTGLLSAFLLAFSPWAIQQAHFATTETMLVFFLLFLLLTARGGVPFRSTVTALAKWMSWRRSHLDLDGARQRHADLSAVSSGIILGLALAAKTTSLLFAVIPLTALWLPDKISPWRKFVKHELWTKLRATIVFFLTAAGTFLTFSPYMVIDRVHFLESMRYETGVVVGRFTVPYTLQFLGTTPYLYQFQTMLWQAGPIAALGIVGIMTLFVFLFLKRGEAGKFAQDDKRIAGPSKFFCEQQRCAIVFLIFPLLYLAWSGSWFAKFSRYNVPFLPFLTIAAAWLIVWVTKKMYVVWCDRIVQHTTLSSFFLIGRIGLLVGLVGLHTLWGVANWTIYTRPQTRIEASKWMYQHIPKDSLIYTEHWNDGLPVTLPGWQTTAFRRELLTPYEPDNETKLGYWTDKLARGDYFILTTPRISRTMPKLTEKYPITSRVYSLLFNGQLGYKEVAAFTSYPQILGIVLSDEPAEESLSVFDHPTVRIFQNIERLSKEELRKRIMPPMGSMP